MAAHKPTLRRQYSIGGGGPGQARRLLQCCGCREILQGSNFTYYQFKKDDAARKRCRMCSMKVREELRVATLKKWGRVEEGAGLIRAAREGNFAQVMFDIERGEKLTQRDPLVRAAVACARVFHCDACVACEGRVACNISRAVPPCRRCASHRA